MAAVASSVYARSLALADGASMPLLGLGVWQMENTRECVDAVRGALEEGYRHIDTAQDYGNEESVGVALRDSSVPREEIFVTTKFSPVRDDPVVELEASLRRLGLEYVDLYLVHWPAGGPLWAWPGMERTRKLGYTRSIGVSNFDREEIQRLVRSTEDPPVVNQVHFNPFAYRKRLLEACSKNSIATEAYSPLGTGQHLNDATVARIATTNGRTPAQVLLRWGIQHGVPQIPKSTHRTRIAENANVFDFTLNDDEMRALDNLDQTGGTSVARENKWWRS